MKNSEYWIERFAKLEEAQNRKSKEYLKTLKREYYRAILRIERDITNWYTRLADNNEISYAEVKKILDKKQLKEFKWTIEEYISKGKENGINQKWIKQLENASTRVHIDRLEAIKIQIQNELEDLYDMQNRNITELEIQNYKEGYYESVYKIQSGMEKYWNIQALDTNKIEKIIAKPWTTDNRTFSDRIWLHKEMLLNTLQKDLTQAIIRGDSLDSILSKLSKDFYVSRNKAGRLVMTESAFFSSAGQKECFNSLGVKQYEIVATLDTHTSKICQELDGKVFDMRDYEIGITAPPFHPNCRSCTVPYFDDEFTQDEKRFYRDEEGKTGYVDSKMKYKEWKEKYVTKNVRGDTILKKDKKEEEMNYQDITTNWKDNATPNSHKIKLNNKDFIDSKTNIIYTVDNKHVIFKPSKNEQNVASWLKNILGGKIEINPRISEPPNVKIPDYYFRGMRFDLKEISGNGKNTIDTAIKSKREQTDNFILDIQEKCKIKDDEIIKQIEKIYNAKNREWVNIIIVKRKDKLIGIYKRKRN